MKTGIPGPALAAALVLGVALAGPSAAFHVGYDYYCYATNSDGIPVTDDATLTGQWFVAGDYVKTGDFGNYGSVTFHADISTATISATAHSHGLQTGPYTFPSGTGRVDRIDFRDRLFFTVPAGYYPDGVQVGISGRMVGTIASDVGAGVMVHCMVSLEGATFDPGLLQIGVDESGLMPVDEPFTLTTELVAPGTTLNGPVEYARSVTAGIYDGRTWSTAYNPGGGSVIGDGDIDFLNGLRILSMQIPPGVTWVSESGVFPSLPTAAPDRPAVARSLRLENFPNPFAPMTTIRYELPRPTTVDLRVFDVTGRLVTVLVAGELRPAGAGQVVWRGNDHGGRTLPSGTYFYRLTAGNLVAERKMLLLR